MISKDKLLKDVLDTVCENANYVFEDKDKGNTKTLAYINGYCDMANQVLKWMDEADENKEDN